jgi:hypothetical protein
LEPRKTLFAGDLKMVSLDVGGSEEVPGLLPTLLTVAGYGCLELAGDSELDASAETRTMMHVAPIVFSEA